MALSKLGVSIVANAIIIRYDRGEGTVDEIIAANYPRLTADEITLIKADIATKRPDIAIQ